jgi:hypothetical protein
VIALVSTVGAAVGSKAAAAALACACSDVDRAALLIDFDEAKPPRPTLLTTAAARRLEERLLAHLPGAAVAPRGAICHLRLPADSSGVEQVPAVLPLVRDSAAIVHLEPHRLQPILAAPRIDAGAALLRADLRTDRSLTALAARELIDRGIRVAVLKRPLGWLASRAALLGTMPAASPSLSPAIARRLLGEAR